MKRLAWPLLLALVVSACGERTSARTVAATEEPAANGRALACNPETTRRVEVEIDGGAVVRDSLPDTLYGFNMPWFEFVDGHLRAGGVRGEIIDWLRPFKGALYRYPGGSPGNWFEWRKAIGPAPDRPKQHSNYEVYAPVRFGFPELFAFLKQVDGKAVLTLNLNGPYKQPRDADWVARENLDLMRWVASADGAGCAQGSTCPVAYWEMGNEMDWSGFDWSADQYAQRVNRIVALGAKDFPEARWVVHGRSAPWEPLRRLDWHRWQTALASQVDARVMYAASHPYYDGTSVPESMEFIEGWLDDWRSKRGGKGFGLVTEHARWPSMPASGRWEDNWAETDNMDGAVSVCDMQLAMMGSPGIVGTNLHAIATYGPWRLFRWDKERDRVFPSPLYWGLRVLRAGTLDRLVKITPSTVEGRKSYAGSYDMRLLASRAADGRTSVMGVNRDARNVLLVLSYRNGAPISANVDFNWIAGTRSDDNVVGNERRIAMQTEPTTLAPGRAQSTWCVPGGSVFSIVDR